MLFYVSSVMLLLMISSSISDLNDFIDIVIDKSCSLTSFIVSSLSQAAASPSSKSTTFSFSYISFNSFMYTLMPSTSATNSLTRCYLY